MTVGHLFLFLALAIFFLAGVGVGFPNPLIWGLFALTLGLLLGGVPLPWGRG